MWNRDKDKDYFEQFCDKLRSKVPDLHLWAASCFHGSELISDEGWSEFSLTRSLRCPPVVVREVIKTREIATDKTVIEYDDRGFPNHTDGLPIKHVHHKVQDHSGAVRDCLRCGQEVASFLCSLKRGDIGRLLLAKERKLLTPALNMRHLWASFALPTKLLQLQSQF